MTGRLADVVSRIGSARQLDAVMAAMRGIAAAREREARERLSPIRAYAAAIGGAINTAKKSKKSAKRSEPVIGC